jgi:outer membrane murein-binding lipoprotein Lpp
MTVSVVELYRAQAAAWAGDLAEATRLLDGLDDSLAVLDLRARVHAQLGELDEADRCWARVREQAPDDVAAAEGRRTIERIRAGRRRARPVVTTGRVTVAAAALACVVLAGGAAWLASGTPQGDDTRLRQEAARARDLQERLAAADSARAAADDELEAAESRRGQALDDVAGLLAMPGVVVQRRDGDVRILFEAGLFGGNGVTVSRDGAALLGELGRRLVTLPVDTTVVGHAVAVPGGPATGGAGIALDRAQAAAELLAAAGGLPLTEFTLVSGDQANGPFPDAARNRTVTLLVTPDSSV